MSALCDQCQRGGGLSGNQTRKDGEEKGFELREQQLQQQQQKPQLSEEKEKQECEPEEEGQPQPAQQKENPAERRRGRLRQAQPPEEKEQKPPKCVATIFPDLCPRSLLAVCSVASACWVVFVGFEDKCKHAAAAC